jgi:hypothetical protein
MIQLKTESDWSMKRAHVNPLRYDVVAVQVRFYARQNDTA